MFVKNRNLTVETHLPVPSGVGTGVGRQGGRREVISFSSREEFSGQKQNLCRVRANPNFERRLSEAKCQALKDESS